MCDAASERRVERVCCPPVIFLPARNLVARGWGNPTDQASRPRGLGQGRPPPSGLGRQAPDWGNPHARSLHLRRWRQTTSGTIGGNKKNKKKLPFLIKMKKIFPCRKLKQIQCDLNDPFVSYIYQPLLLLHCLHLYVHINNHSDSMILVFAMLDDSILSARPHLYFYSTINGIWQDC